MMDARRSLLGGLDPRGIACLRIGVALLILVDLALRSRDLRAMYTDGGMLDRGDVARLYPFLHDWTFSLFMVSGSALWTGVLMGVLAVGAIGLGLGWHTRKMSVLCWLLISGLQLRNLYIGEGYDAVMRLMLLWLCFTDAGGAWSVDGRGRQRTSPVRDIGAVGIFVQIMVVYFCAGWAKALLPVWQSGQAVWLHMHHDFFVTPVGDLFRTVGGLTMAMNHGTLVLELALPLLLLVPIARLRTSLLVFTVAWTFGFWLALDVDLFPFISAASLMALLPPSTLDWVEGSRPFQRVAAQADALFEGLQGVRTPQIPRFMTGLGGVLVVWTLAWNAVVTPGGDPARLGAFGDLGKYVFMQQGFAMFAHPASQTGFVVIDGVLRDGRRVDLMVDGGRVPASPEAAAPASSRDIRPADRYANNRWRSLFRKVAYGEDFEVALHYGRYVCRTWNEREPQASQLMTFQILFMNRSVPWGDSPSYRRDVVWTHDCFS